MAALWLPGRSQPYEPFPSCRGFTKFKREEYLKLRREGRIVPDGVNAKVITSTSHSPELINSVRREVRCFQYDDDEQIVEVFRLSVQLLTWHGSLEGRPRGKGVFPPSVAESA